MTRFPIHTLMLCGMTLCAVAGLASPARADGPPPPPPPSPLEPQALPPGQVGPGYAAPGMPGGPVAEGDLDPEIAALMAPDALKGLVGPVALYPDVVLGSLLPAATSPLDVIEAAGYVHGQGGRAAAVPVGVSWEPAVQAMLQYPEALLKMAEDVAWLRRLGDAVAIDQDAVLSAIQAFRADVAAAGNLPKAPQVVVTTQPAPETGGDSIILIEPALPTVVYVPVYDPYIVCAPAPAPWSLYSWGIGTGFGPSGPWGWTWISWSFSWGWHHHHHHGYHHGGGYHGGYHGGGSSYRRGPATYRPRFGSADVVGVSDAYGPAVIGRSSKVGYHSALRHSTGGATVRRSSGGATTSRAFAPSAGSGNGGTVSVFQPRTSRTNRALGAGTSGSPLSRFMQNRGGAATESETSRRPLIGGTQFRRSQGTDATTPPTGGTRAPRLFTPNTTPNVTPRITPDVTTPRRTATPSAPRTFTPRFTPRSNNATSPGNAPSVTPRSFAPAPQPTNRTPRLFTPNTFTPNTRRAPQTVAPQRTFQAPTVTPRVQAPKQFVAPRVEPRTTFTPRVERNRTEAPSPSPRRERRQR